MATHSSVHVWRISGTGEPGVLPSMGSHRVGHDWSNLAAVARASGVSGDLQGGEKGRLHLAWLEAIGLGKLGVGQLGAEHLCDWLGTYLAFYDWPQVGRAAANEGSWRLLIKTWPFGVSCSQYYDLSSWTVAGDVVVLSTSLTLSWPASGAA